MLKKRLIYIGTWKNNKKHGKGNLSSSEINKYLYEGIKLVLKFNE